MAADTTPTPESARLVRKDGVQAIIAQRDAKSRPVMHPGRGLGVASIFFAVLPGFGPIAGLVAAVVGLRQSQRAGQPNSWAVAGIVVSCISGVMYLLLYVLYFRTIFR